MTALGDKDVGGLDVAVDDPIGMRGIQCVGNLDRQVHKGFGVHRPIRNEMLQRHAIEKFHGDERLPVLLANVVNRADVGMIQRRCSLRFALKAGESLRDRGRPPPGRNLRATNR